MTNLYSRRFKSDASKLIRQDATAGFTLVETMVALIILSAMLGVAFQVVSIGAKSIENANMQQQVLTLANSLIASVNSSVRVNETVVEKNGLSWRIIKHEATSNSLQPIRIEINSPYNSNTYSFFTFENR